MIRIYTLLALLFSLLSLHAQSFMFKHLEVSDGLSNNSVRCIYKDREGLMWFGTLAGLNCYDGYTFKVFTRQEYNQNSLPDNFIESIVELPDGQFWVKTAKGYVLFDKAKEVFQTDLTPFMTSLGSRGVPSDIFVDSKEEMNNLKVENKSVQKQKRVQLFENEDVVLEQRGNRYYLSVL